MRGIFISGCLLYLVFMSCSGLERVYNQYGFDIVDIIPKGEISQSEGLDLDESKVIIWKDSFENWDQTGIYTNTNSTYLITPGDYREWGVLMIRKGGSKDQRLNLLYYDPNSTDSDLSKSNPVSLPVEKKVLLEGFIVRGTYSGPVGFPGRRILPVKYVNLVGLAVSGTSLELSRIGTERSPDFGRKGGPSCRIELADSISIRNCLIENVQSGNALKINANYTFVSGCVIRNCFRVPGADNIGVSISPTRTYENRGNQIVGNEIYNCTDCIQIVNVGDSLVDGYAPNTLIADNDLYITSDYYVKTEVGLLASAENGVDLKVGSDSESSKVLVTGNRIWGMRPTDPNTGGSGGSGAAINLTINADHIELSENIIFDVGEGFVIGTKNSRIAAARQAFITIRKNLIFDFWSDGNNPSVALRSAVGCEVNSNTIVGADILFQSPFSVIQNFERNILVDIEDAKIWSKYHQGKAYDNVWINPPKRIFSSDRKREILLRADDIDSHFESSELSVKRLTDKESIKIIYGKIRNIRSKDIIRNFE